jgi:polyhydroxyalkanoate synthesis regulator phasin
VQITLKPSKGDWMRGRRLVSILVAAIAALLAIGATTALAHGGGPFGSRTQTDLITPAAKELGITVDKLNAAILKDAGARIDRIVKAGNLDEDQAADFKDNLAANPRLAIGLTTATGVARELGITKAKLDDAFRAARKADLTARIDQAVKDGRLTADQAKELKANLDTTTLPGYKGGFGIGHDFGFGLGGRHGPGGGFGFRFGGGFGAAPVAPAVTVAPL